jgi:uncharacterized protein (TIGR02145 family)
MKIQFTFYLFLVAVLSLHGQDKFVDTRDGNVYRTFSVDGVIWMGENIRYKTKPGAFYFDNDSNNVRRYGILYDWNTAKNVCPKNWHLPTGMEFQNLVNHLEQNTKWVGSNPSSFGIQFGGMQDFEGVFSELDESGYYWTSTEYSKSNAEYFSYLMIIEMPVIDISRKEDISDIPGTEKSNKYSVRCVRN